MFENRGGSNTERRRIFQNRLSLEHDCRRNRCIGQINLVPSAQDLFPVSERLQAIDQVCSLQQFNEVLRSRTFPRRIPVPPLVAALPNQ